MAITRFRGEHFFLSNMYPFQNGIRTPDGIIVHTSEQLYLSARIIGYAARLAVERTADGFAAKRAFNKLVRHGASVRLDWDSVREQKMRDCLAVKFKANPDIAQQLLETGDEELIEGNARGDRYWGVSPPPPNGAGLNMLGRLLMETREGLRNPDALDDVDTLVARIYSPADTVPKIVPD